MSEVAVVEQATEVEVIVPLDDARAKMLDNRIKTCVENIGDRLTVLHKLLDEAQQGQVHLTMGFRSWTEYLTDRIGNRWQIGGDERREMAQLLADRGMSVRGIAAITGASKSTVARVLEEVSHDGTPDGDGAEVTDGEQLSHNGTPVSDGDKPAVPNGTPVDEQKTVGLDGKEYRKPKPRKKPEPNPDESAPADAAPAARAVQVPTAVRALTKTLRGATDELSALTYDKRWDKALARLTDADAEALQTIAVTIADIHAGIASALLARTEEPA
ncbi:helix-turn-helix domain-containing protein [Mycobacteroides chelonae]|uniref:helix-turn-helix domain-containing protein n=1 Tax=Mycobacteroides chelonae TaxID=1774 RepID=UPI0018B06CF4|nr:helix-turn-helix domain-containing protein [Mycobacteroides chelonae]MBF9316550.1 helix-turn-helix domain-containing protein [Mycobacteroides chelonae]